MCGVKVAPSNERGIAIEARDVCLRRGSALSTRECVCHNHHTSQISTPCASDGMGSSFFGMYSCAK